MNELDTKATERSGNTNNWFIKKKTKKKKQWTYSRFFQGKKTENTINVGNEKVHKLQLI